MVPTKVAHLLGRTVLVISHTPVIGEVQDRLQSRSVKRDFAVLGVCQYVRRGFLHNRKNIGRSTNIDRIQYWNQNRVILASRTQFRQIQKSLILHIGEDRQRRARCQRQLKPIVEVLDTNITLPRQLKQVGEVRQPLLMLRQVERCTHAEKDLVGTVFTLYSRQIVNILWS